MCESGSCRRVRDADKVLTGRTLNLSASNLSLALQRLIAVRAVKLKLGRVHIVLLTHAQMQGQKHGSVFCSYFFSVAGACSVE